MIEEVKALLRLHEGVRDAPYRCSGGFLTIGVGHNLDAKTLSHRAIEAILDDDLTDVMRDVSKLACYAGLEEVRQAVLIDMCFNLGFGGLCKFRNMLAALEDRDFDRAADEMMNSRWAVQVGSRATRLETMMRTGSWPDEV